MKVDNCIKAATHNLRKLYKHNKIKWYKKSENYYKEFNRV